MKTIIHLELDKTQLEKLASVIEGRETRRPATRKEVSSFVDGCIDRALAEQPALVSTPLQTSGLSMPPQHLIDKATTAGLNIKSYTSGWNNPAFSGA